MELIDKDRIVAEIEKRIDSNNERAAFYSSNSEHDYLCRVKERVYESLLSFLNTIDVKKDVDLDECARHYLLHEHISPLNDVFHQADLKVEVQYHKDIENAYKKGFELGLKTRDWREERMKECPYRKVGCTMYSGTILECRGACSWVVDYPKLKELEEKKGE